MNIVLWVLQIILALHTAVGAAWKLSMSAAESSPALAAIPPSVWLLLVPLELLAAVLFILPKFYKAKIDTAAIAGAMIAVEMLAFILIATLSGKAETAQIIYWLVVAALCDFIFMARYFNLGHNKKS